MVASPPPALFWRRDLIWRQNHAISRGTFDPFTSFGQLTRFTPPISDGMSDPLARETLMTRPELASFRRWSILPMARVDRERCRTVVQYQDARFGGLPGGGRLGREVVLPGAAPGC